MIMLWLLLLSPPVNAAVGGIPCPTTLQSKASIIVSDLDGHQANKNSAGESVTTGNIEGVTSTDSIFP